MKLTLIFFGIEILCFLLIFFCVLINEKKQHFSHKKNVENLEKTISFNNEKKKFLENKVLISDEYKSNYQKSIKMMSQEIVELQDIFLKVISNKKIN